MDFMSRGGRQTPQNTNEHQSLHSDLGAQGGGVPHHEGDRKMSDKMRLAVVVLVFSVAIVLSGLSVYMATAKRGKYIEATMVNRDKYQAVFLNGGQVYFGKVKALNRSFITIEDIYYLRVNQQVQPGTEAAANTDISLAKLGNELHGPEDQMVINRDQVMFWENLKDDGQVVKAITDYKANGGSGSNQQQGSSNTPAATPPATTPPTTNNTNTNGNR